MKNYKVIVSWNDGGKIRQTAGAYKTIEAAHRKQREVINQLPLSALEEHITVSIEKIQHKQ